MPASILELLEDRDDLSTFVRLLNRSRLRERLEEDTEYTVFAPKNVAFEKLDDATYDQLLDPEHRDRLRRIMRRHLVARHLESAQFKDRDVETLGGWEASLTSDQGQWWFAGARLTRPDFTCRDGVIHVVDGVFTDGM
jgi:uncharacterized surface protein with fasciclin (FAS1) repeats